MEFILGIVALVGVLLAAVCGWVALRAQAARSAAEREGASATARALALEEQAARAGEELERARAEGAASAARAAQDLAVAVDRAQSLEIMLTQRDGELASAAAMHRQEMEGMHAQHLERIGALERERARFEKQVEQLKETFQALASQTLKGVSEELLVRANETFAAKGKEAQLEMDKRSQQVMQMVKPVSETLGRAQEQLASLEARVNESKLASEGLRLETQKLSRALSRPEVRGRYGEIQLRRVAELAGMTSYCDFTEQTSSRDGEGNLLRPDMVVRLPNERVIAVDAKANIDAYVQAASSATAEEQELHFARFADHIEGQIKKLSDKKYWAQFEGAPEFVVMFVPGDQFLDAALSRKPNLLDVAAQQNVIMASPSTLIGLLRAVAVGWREHKLTEDAVKLFELGRELHDRVATAMGHAGRLGSAINSAAEQYNKFASSVETRLLPTIRKFEESGVRSAKEVEGLPEVEVRARLVEGAVEGRE
ncbi:DNA recombination protein RmuC [Nodularia spumigena]|uniref:DNA recombination protein RmuC n=1 Tax=Nodularia spumigena TaxID=70799 RepID=UPI002B21E751|nr:DNA recombination protein RmuC [Nodularia spumigena]MEA5556283.1 DNA recombination protein RmuC [Nodularia spumigena CH309]